MKVKIKASGPDYEKIKEELESHGIEVVDDSSLCIYLEDISPQKLFGKKEGKIFELDINKIEMFECYDHDVFAIIDDISYSIDSTLKELEEKLKSFNFLRINKSEIVNINMIDYIVPIFGMKFKLTLKSKKYVYVTRTYYYNFKNKIGF